ncbi:MAG: hypothetical protein AAF431_12940 [Pseudomonadota bacterium]
MSKADHLKQTMLALAYTVDAADVVDGDGVEANITAGKIAKCVIDCVPELKGQWEVVWGPRVYDFPLVANGHSNNTMMVVQNTENPNTYVVAIAGTDPKSWSDWVFEDFLVWKTKPWVYGNPPSNLKPEISTATWVGLSTLQAITPVAGTPSHGMTLSDFFASVMQNTDADVSIYVTGHSLGGALAPAVACWLNDTKPRWDATDQSTLHAYAFAGATPGNGDFASWMNSQFTGDQLVRVSNTLDLVPHAWNYDTLMEVPGLYPQPYTLPRLLDGVVSRIATDLQHIDYQFVGEGDQIQPIEGTVYDIDPIPHSQLERFFAQVLKQHVDAYPEKLGMPNLNSQMKSCQEKYL